jgi:putative ABC transport system permease protein
VVATFIVRAKGDPAALAPSFRGAIADVDRSQAVTNVSTVDQYAAGQLEDLRHYAALLGAFGGVSVALSIVGLFGIMAHAVSQRTNEIGIRVALGAGAGSVLGLVARQALVLVGAGMFVGVAASLMLTRIVASFLWGVSSTDPLTFALSLAAMSAVSVLACYVPARRALKIDPIMALKWE